MDQQGHLLEETYSHGMSEGEDVRHTRADSKLFFDVDKLSEQSVEETIVFLYSLP